MAQVERVSTTITASISFTGEELVYLRELTQNAKFVPELSSTTSIRESIWRACTNALKAAKEA